MSRVEQIVQQIAKEQNVSLTTSYGNGAISFSILLASEVKISAMELQRYGDVQYVIEQTMNLVKKVIMGSTLYQGEVSLLNEKIQSQAEEVELLKTQLTTAEGSIKCLKEIIIELSDLKQIKENQDVESENKKAN